MIQKEKLAKIVGAENVFDEHEVVGEYARDMSFVPPGRPEYVVKPRSKDDVQSIVKWANETRVPLVPVSSGPPHFRGDTIPRFGGVIVDLSNMKRIIRIDRSNRVAMIEPGVRFGELQEALRKEGMRLPMPLCPRSTKSVIASCLEREPHIIPKYHLDMSEPLLCNEVIFATGDLFYTGEAAGPGRIEEQWKVGRSQKDHMGRGMISYYRLIQGSQGTIGIVTWSTVRCEVLPLIQRPFLVTSNRVERLFDFVYKILRLRLGDECLFLNDLNLASILVKDSESIKVLRETLPPWILFVCIAGYECLPKERVDYQEKDMMEIARETGVELVDAVSSVSAMKVLKTLSSPSEEPYWKVRYKGGCQDIFFITTLDKTPKFIRTMCEMAGEMGYPITDMGIYLQPVNQGHNCHCEFNLTYDPANNREQAVVENFFLSASKTLMDMGGFFSRPYGPWANMVYNRDAMTKECLLKLKAIFDPNNILNPGKLCF